MDNEATKARNLRPMGGDLRPSSNLRPSGVGAYKPPVTPRDIIDALQGHIGGWRILNGRLTADAGSAEINANTPSIRLGSATDYLTGTGFFVGKSAGAYKFHIGDPAGAYMGWSGSGMVAGGNWITGNAVNFLNIPIDNGATWTSNSPTAGKVAWNSFTLTYQGTNYTIDAGNTLNKYIWWNKATSTTVLQSSNTAPDNAVDQFMMCLNSGGTALPALFQNVIYADYIKTAQLSAISADLGTITAGTITGGTIRTAASGARVQMDGTYLAGYGSDGTTKQFYLDASTGKAFAGAGNTTFDVTGIAVATAAGGGLVDAARTIRITDADGVAYAWLGGQYKNVVSPPENWSQANVLSKGRSGDTAAITFMGAWLNGESSGPYLRIERNSATGNSITLDAEGGSILTGGISMSGTLTMGDDANLYRSAANVLATDDNLVVMGYVDLQGSVNVRSTINVQNKANTGWLALATRDTSGAEAVYNLAYLGTVSAASKYICNGSDGLSRTVTEFTAWQYTTNPDPPNNIWLQYKTRALTFTGGILTAAGAESAWQTVSGP